MEFRVLQYFLMVAREESISGAAQRLHLSQPTLSRQLKDMEDELGKQLFLRGNRKITLTAEGMLLRKRAEEILELMYKTESEIACSDDTVCGDIYIGGGETEGIRCIMMAIQRIRSKYPDIRFHIHSGNAVDVKERIDKGLLDFGVLIEPSDIHKYDVMKLPHQDQWGLLMRKDSPFAEKNYITPEDVINLPIICSSQDMVRQELAAWMHYDFDKLNLVATYNLIYNASIMVEENVGYAFSLDHLTNINDRSILTFRPLKPELKVGLVLVWKKYQVFSKATELFLDELRNVLHSPNMNT